MIESIRRNHTGSPVQDVLPLDELQIFEQEELEFEQDFLSGGEDLQIADTETIEDLKQQNKMLRADLRIVSKDARMSGNHLMSLMREINQLEEINSGLRAENAILREQNTELRERLGEAEVPVEQRRKLGEFAIKSDI